MDRKKGELFSLLLLSLACRCFCQPFPYIYYVFADYYYPYDVAINSESGEVFVALGSSVIRLNSRLELQEEIPVDGHLLQLTLSPNNDWLLACVDMDWAWNVHVFSSADLSRGNSTSVSTLIFNDTYTSQLELIATYSGFYLGAVQFDDEYYPVSMWLGQYNYTSSSPVREGYYNFSTRRLFDRFFIGGFSKNNFVYFFVNDVETERAAIRVLRVCDCDQSCSSNDFEALYELELRCSCDSRLGLSSINSVTLLESFANLNETVILLLDNDVTCGLSLSSINEDIHTTYKSCANNAQASFQLPWEEYPQQCVNFSVSNNYCSYNIPHVASYYAMALNLKLVYKRGVARTKKMATGDIFKTYKV